MELQMAGYQLAQGKLHSVATAYNNAFVALSRLQAEELQSSSNDISDTIAGIDARLQHIM